MANLDTTSKRRSSCQILQPWQLHLPTPVAGIDLADRAHVVHDYSGILPLGIIALNHTLIIVDSVFPFTAELNHSLSHTLTITDFATGAVFAYSLSNTITISDNVVQNYDLPTNPTSDLVIEDSVSGKFTVTSLGLEHTLHIDDEVLAAGVQQQSYALNDSLSIVDEVRHVRAEISVSNTLVITDSVLGSIGLASNIVLVDSVTTNLSKGLVTTLTIVDEAVATSARAFSLASTLTIADSVVGYNHSAIQRGGLCNYAPIISYGDPIPTTAPVTSKQPIIVLTFPYVAPSLTLQLRAPSYENAQKDAYNRILRESRGGDGKIYRDSIWPKSKLQSYEIVFNKNQEVLDFLNFLSVSVGKEVGLLDYLNRQWKGILIPSEIQTTHAGRSNRIVNFEFEGDLV